MNQPRTGNGNNESDSSENYARGRIKCRMGTITHANDNNEHAQRHKDNKCHAIYKEHNTSQLLYCRRKDDVDKCLVTTATYNASTKAMEMTP